MPLKRPLTLSKCPTRVDFPRTITGLHRLSAPGPQALEEVPAIPLERGSGSQFLRRTCRIRTWDFGRIECPLIPELWGKGKLGLIGGTG